MKITFDTYAWVEYFLGTNKGKEIEKYFANNEIITPITALIELDCKAAKHGWDKDFMFEFVKSKSNVFFINWEITKISSQIYLEQRKKFSDFGLNCAIILATSRVNNSKLLTGDKHFKGLSDVIFLE